MSVHMLSSMLLVALAAVLITATESVDQSECAEDKYQCTDGFCIPDYYVCDTYADCNDAEDEKDCAYEEDCATPFCAACDATGERCGMCMDHRFPENMTDPNACPEPDCAIDGCFECEGSDDCGWCIIGKFLDLSDGSPKCTDCAVPGCGYCDSADTCNYCMDDSDGAEGCAHLFS